MKDGKATCSFIVLLWIFILAGLLSVQGQVVINELMVYPGGNPAIRTNSIYTECDRVGGSATETQEWIELFNTSPCDTVDLSCYTLAANNDTVPNICANNGSGGLNAGAFTLPRGTKIPPLGFITIGGVNGGRDATFNLLQYKTRGYLCTGNRWFLNNSTGWIALYDPNAVPVDAVYWGNGPSPTPDIIRTNTSFNRDVSTNCTCKGSQEVVSFPSARSLSTMSKITYIGNVMDDFFSNNKAQFFREPDGGIWRSNQNTPTPNRCNAKCLQAGELVYLTPTLKTICPGDSVLLTALPFNPSMTGIQYSWRSIPAGVVGTTQSLAFFLTKSAQIIVTSTKGACSDSDTAYIQVLDAPAPTFSVNPWRLCAGDTAIIRHEAPSVPNVRYEWTFDGGIAIPGTGPGPHKVVWNTPGSKTVGLLVRNNQCSSDYRYEAVDVLPSPIASYSVDKDTLCGDEFATITFTGTAGNSAVFSWKFDGGIASPGTGRGPHTIRWNSSGRKTISLTVKENGCSSNEVLRNIWVGNGVNTRFSINPSPVCLGDSASISLSDPPTQGASYVWNFDQGIAIPGTGAGPHRVKWSSSGKKNIRLTVTVSGCPPQTVQQTIDVLPAPEITLDAQPLTVCVGQKTTIKPSLTGASIGNWSFDGGNATPGSGVISQEVIWSNPGIKSVRFSASQGSCTTVKEVKIDVRPQPNATFDVQPKNVCEGEEVNVRFTGFAPNNPFFNWDFNGAQAVPGTGIGPHTLTWSNSGKKIIRLRLENGDCISQEYKDSVTVKPQPQALFTLMPNPVCVGAPVTLSYIGNAPVSANFRWDFGGGDVITEELNRRYKITWLSEGDRNISLSVIQDNCASETVSQTIRVLPVPQASFTVIPDELCVADTAIVTFTGTATINAVFDWRLDGGSIISGSGRGPLKITWRNEGSKTITLSVNDRQCVSNTVSKNVKVNFAPTAEFSVTPPNICESETVSVQYNGTGTAQALINWTLDGGRRLAGGTDTKFDVIWNSTGDKKITLQVKEGDCPPRFQTQYVNITPYPTAEFSLEPNPACIGEDVILTYTGMSLPNAQFNWNFGSGVVMAGGLGKGPHRLRWTQSGNYTVKLDVSQNNCSAPTVEKEIKIKPTPSSIFSAFPNEVCENEPLRLVYSGKIEPNTFFFWKTEGADRNEDFNPTPQPFIYSSFGNKTVELFVIQDNCPSEPYRLDVKVKKVPKAEFVFSRPVICQTDTVQIIFTGEAEANAVFFWEAVGVNKIDDTNPRKMTFSYPDSGLKTVRLFVVQEGCTSAVKSHTLKVLPTPVAEFKTGKNVLCKDEYSDVRFTGFATNGTQYLWDFGDAEVRQNANPQGPHTIRYNTTGVKYVRLQLVTEPCSSKLYEKEIKVINPTADFQVTSPICLNERAIVTLTGNVPDESRLVWEIENGRIAGRDTNNFYYLQFFSAGVKRVALRIISEQCTSQRYSSLVRVYDFPRAKVKVEPDSGRAPLTVKFYSEIDTIDVRRVWNFDDRKPEETIESNPTHRYDSHGIFEPTLLLTNSANCSTVLKLKVEVTTREIFIPNAFSPNGDENNEKFLIFNLPGIYRYRFSVFNRWGEKVFETTDINTFWDGTFNGSPVPEGAYVYHLVAEEYDGYVFTKTGTITLIR